MSFNQQFQLNFLMEQLQKYGSNSLSDQELFYCVLSLFCSDKLATMVTYRFFNENHSLAHLNYLTLQNWNHYFKLSSKSLKIQLLCEFNNRC